MVVNYITSNNGEVDAETANLNTSLVLQPFTYVTAMKGKNFRKKLATAVNDWFCVSENDLETIQQISDKLHNSSLIIDDIEDYSELRRGKPAAHIVYGIPMSINAANYVYFDALKMLLSWGSMKAVETFTEHLLLLHHGQGMELYWRDSHLFKNNGESDNQKENGKQNGNIFNQIIPTVQEYHDVIVMKTVGGMGLITALMNDRGQKKLDLSKLTNLVGTWFQVRDDFCNLTSLQYAGTKGFCEDITEGKLSFPVIYSLNNESFPKEKKQRLWEILEMKTTCVKLKKEALQLLRESGAIQYTKEKVVQLKKDLIEETERLGGNQKLMDLIENL